MLSASGKSTAIVPRGTQYYQLAMKYDKWTGDIIRGWVPPGRVCSHCTPGELSITSSLLNIITSGLAILFNVECPRGRVYSHCAPGELSIISWTSNCSNPNGSLERANCNCAPGGFVITSWLWNIITGWSLFNVECSRENLLSLSPRGTQYHHLALKYWRNIVTKFKGHIVLFNVECPLGRVNSHCASSELVNTSRLWHIITSGLVIVQC